MNRYQSLILSIVCSLCLFVAGMIVSTISYASTPDEILSKIVNLKADSLNKKLKDAGFLQMPVYISVRIYKLEKTLEIWAGMDDQSEMKILARYPICAIDYLPGPKLREGDERTPEGTFELKEHYHSKNWYMHIDLRPGMVENEGNEKTGDSFYFCTDYPTSFNKALSKSIGISKPGTAICIHGNCVSVGCPSLVNEDFIEVYYWIMQHDKNKFGAPKVHILPLRFYDECSSGGLLSDEMFCSTEVKAKQTNDVAHKLMNQKEQIIKNTGLINEKVCIKNNIQTKPYCPSERFKNKFSIMLDYCTKINKDSEALGDAMIKKLWLQMASSEKKFLSSPIPANAELGLTNDLLTIQPKEISQQ